MTGSRNLLGLNMHSSDRVLPEFQDLRVGETIAYGPNVMRLERVEPGHVMAWRAPDGNWVWSKMLRGIKERAETLASEGANGMGRTSVELCSVATSASV